MRRDDTTGDALRYLAQHGQSPSKDVARAVGWGSRTAGAKMAGLEKQGLVSRVKVRQQTFSSDARYEWLLTARGFELCPRWFAPEADDRPRLEADLAALREAAQAVVSAYEGVTTTDEWLSLAMPIVGLRAVLASADSEEER